MNRQTKGTRTRAYTQLTQGQRYQIEALLKTGHNEVILQAHEVPVPSMKAKVKYHIPVPSMKVNDDNITATGKYHGPTQSG